MEAHVFPASDKCLKASLSYLDMEGWAAITCILQMSYEQKCLVFAYMMREILFTKQRNRV